MLTTTLHGWQRVGNATALSLIHPALVRERAARAKTKAAFIEVLVMVAAQRQQETERLDTAQRLLLGADFAWGDPADPHPVVVLALPPGVRIGADLRQFLDASAGYTPDPAQERGMTHLGMNPHAPDGAALLLTGLRDQLAQVGHGDMGGLDDAFVTVELLASALRIVLPPETDADGCTCGEAYGLRTADVPKCAYCLHGRPKAGTP